MPAKVTSKIAWKSKAQKRKARRIAKMHASSLSAYIQQHFDSPAPDAPQT